MTLLVVLLLVVSAALAVLARLAAGRRRPDEELLRLRYAVGEIDTEEYRTRITILRSAR